MIKVSENFSCVEFVPPEIDAGPYPNTWFIDPDLVVLCQLFRDTFGSVTINNWYWGGQYKYSGFRPPTTSVGGKLSQHRFGRAGDLKFKDKTVQEVYREILASEYYWYTKGLRVLENVEKTPTWLHIDIRDTGSEYLNKIKIVNP